MELIKNLKENQFGSMEGEVYFPWEKKNITITFHKDVPIEYAEKTAQALNDLDDSVMDKVVKGLYAYYQEAIEDNPDIIEDIDMDNVEDENDIIEHMSLETLTVTVPEDGDPDKVGLNLDGACDWTEDWLQCIIIGSKVVYLGPFRFEDMWYPDYSELDDDENYIVD